MKIKTFKDRVKEIDEKSSKFSEEMSSHEYTITAEKIDIPLKKMKKLVRMMGFKNSETEKIIASVKVDLVGKEMHKGDDFKKLIADAFTKAITSIVEEIQKGKDGTK